MRQAAPKRANRVWEWAGFPLQWANKSFFLPKPGAACHQADEPIVEGPCHDPSE